MQDICCHPNERLLIDYGILTNKPSCKCEICKKIIDITTENLLAYVGFLQLEVLQLKDDVRSLYCELRGEW